MAKFGILDARTYAAEGFLFDEFVEAESASEALRGRSSRYFTATDVTGLKPGLSKAERATMRDPPPRVWVTLNGVRI